MENMRNWVLLSSFVFAGYVFGTNTAEKSLIMVSNEGDPMNTPKNSYTVSASTLEEGEKLFDLICVGECDFKKGTQPIGICGDKDNYPMLIEVGKDGDSTINGQIIFKKLSSIWTISMPAGHQAYVTVAINGIKGKYDEIAKYCALKIQKNEETDAGENRILRLPVEEDTSNASVDMLMESGTVVELIPVFSKSDMRSGGYELVEIGKPVVDECNFITENTDSFNFGTVFRVCVTCRKTAPSETFWRISK